MEKFANILKTLDLTPQDALMILVSIALFLLLWRTLARVLFAPYMALLDAREAATSGAHSAADATKYSAEELRRSYDGRMHETRVKTLQEKSAALEAAKQQAAEMVERAEAEAQEILRTARWEMAQKVDALKLEAFREADQLAEQIAQKLLQPARPAQAHVQN